MVITATNSKLALMSWQQPWLLPLPISSDGLGQADTQQLLWGYPGILWSVPVPVVPHIAVFGRLAIFPRLGHEVLRIRGANA
jgi:hypothetical protein